MQLSGYLIISKSNRLYRHTARFVKTIPKISSNEISVKLECNIPDQMFTIPQLKFIIDVPKDAIPKKEITAEVKGNIQDIIKQNLGIEVHLIAEENNNGL